MGIVKRTRRSARGQERTPPQVEQLVLEAPTEERPETVEIAPPQQRVVLNGRYELGRPIGTGGMASVHVARDLLLRREVAIKLFRRDSLAGPDVRLQEIEARVIATLNHSALTTLLDAGIETTDSGPPQIYLVMEYVRGSNLRQRLKQGPLEVSEACWLGFDVAEGLDHMHQSGFMHRDVKPANILISDRRSARPVVAKLTDFGIASPIGQPDLSEYTVGTAAYLSPEQVEGEDARPESDIYSLGIVLLEAITGEVAFPGSVEESAFARLVRDPSIPDSVPAPVADLLSRMTARRPEQRAPLHEVAVELQQFLVDDLVRRRSPTPSDADATPPSPVLVGSPTDGLGSTPDPTCDALVRLLAVSLGVPKALLTVVDGGRVASKAQHGWDAPVVLAEDREPSSWSRSLSRTRATPDVRGRDLATRAVPVADPDVVAAANAALVTHDGRVIGELFVFDHAPREFTQSDLTTLSDVAGLLAHEFELRAVARRALLGGVDGV